MSELVMRKMDGKNKLFKKTVKKCDDKEEKGEKHDSAKEEKAEDKEHKEHSEFPKKVTDQIAHDHMKMGKGGGGKGGGNPFHISKEEDEKSKKDFKELHTIHHGHVVAKSHLGNADEDEAGGRGHYRGDKIDMGKGGGGGVRHGKKAKKMSFFANSAKKWEKK
jgi:hypothetical protein